MIMIMSHVALFCAGVGSYLRYKEAHYHRIRLDQRGVVIGMELGQNS